ncbi:MAG: hypothetical protein Q7U54_07925 [Bacteroidales bacterium]|nr:hypothetical protein [Bacteroidales bacterium]
MLKSFFNAIQTRLGQIVTIPAPIPNPDPEGEPIQPPSIPVIKQIGWWNEQWQFEQQNPALKFPCVFIELVSFPWEQLGNKVQQANAVIKFHIGSRTLDDDSVDHLDLIEIINYWITGFQGTNFGSFTRTAFEADHNHDSLVAHSLTYKVRVQDNTAIRPRVRVEGDLLVIDPGIVANA